MKRFNAKKVKQNCIEWIQKWFEENGKGCNAVVGISSGKDSTITAALLIEALGKSRVIGVLMPQGIQADIDISKQVIEILGITSYTININDAVAAITDEMSEECITPSTQTRTNLPARIRMATLYAISQSHNGRVVNTCNLSEDWVGYATRYGDAAGDFSPLANLTVAEVKAIGYELGLPRFLIEKTPSDGLCGKTDEDNLGFTYAVLDKYIRSGVCNDAVVKARIDTMHEKNLFKLLPMPTFTPDTEDLGSISTKITEIQGNLLDAPRGWTLVQCLSGDYEMKSGLAAQLDAVYDLKNRLETNWAPSHPYNFVGETILIGDVLNLIIKASAKDTPAWDEFCEALENLAINVKDMSIKKLAMPKIGCGHNGFQWTDVSAKLEELFSDTDVQIVVYSL